MVKIRLMRMGRHKRPFYRIVVADSRSPRNGKQIDNLGTYDPFTKKTTLKEENALKWLKEGARTTQTVKTIFNKSPLHKKEREKNTHGSE